MLNPLELPGPEPGREYTIHYRQCHICGEDHDVVLNSEELTRMLREGSVEISREDLPHTFVFRIGYDN